MAELSKEHLLDWPKVLYGNQPIDSGYTAEESVEILKNKHPEYMEIL